jgi:phosphate transport system substrate-binding protein
LYKSLSINGYTSGLENIYNGKYPLVNQIYFIYKEDNLNQAAKDFLEFAVAPQGQRIAERSGLLPIAVE